MFERDFKLDLNPVDFSLIGAAIATVVSEGLVLIVASAIAVNRLKKLKNK